MAARVYPPGLGGLSETDAAALVQQVRAGDRQAWARLYEHGRTAVERYLAHRVREQADVPDVVQETFVRLPQFAARFEPGRDTVGAWLCGQVASYSLAEYGHQRWRRTSAEAQARDTAQAGPVPVAESAQERESRPLSARMVAALQALPPQQRDMVQLRHVEQLEAEDAARQSGITRGAALRRDARARQGLRAQLADLAPSPVSALVSLPKREAVTAALGVLGPQASAPQVVAWLRTQGVRVSRSCVHNTRKAHPDTPTADTPTADSPTAGEGAVAEGALAQRLRSTDAALRAAGEAIGDIDAATRAAQADDRHADRVTWWQAQDARARDMADEPVVSR